MKQLVLLPVIIIALCSCSNQTKPKQNQEVEHVVESEDASYLDEVQIHTLPTPIQLPSLIKNSNLKYYPSIHLPIKKSDPTTYKTGVLFGAYLMNMSYAGVFSNHQTCLNYLNRCKELSPIIGVSPAFKESELRRLKQNLSYPDSVSSVLINLYDLGHQSLLRQNKDGIGLLVVLGCYMEGMHILLNQVRLENYLLFKQALSMQFMYGQNLKNLLSQYQIPDEVFNEYEAFSNALSALEKYSYPLPKDHTHDQSVSPNLLPELNKCIVKYREGINAY